MNADYPAGVAYNLDYLVMYGNMNLKILRLGRDAHFCADLLICFRVSRIGKMVYCFGGAMGAATQLSRLSKNGFFGGLAIVMAVGMSLCAGVVLLPELSWRGQVRESVMHQRATVLLREREFFTEYVHEKERALGELSNAEPLDEGRRKRLTDEVEGARRSLSIILDKIYELQKEEGGIAALSEMGYERNFLRPPSLSRYTDSQIVQLLAIVMGAVGGMISVARCFVLTGVKDPRPSDYFIRPLFGAVMAAVVYMALKAGQFVLTASGSTEPVNPYTIGLVALVSGLLGEEALGAIERWGGGMFQRLDPGSISAAMIDSLSDLKQRLQDAINHPMDDEGRRAEVLQLVEQIKGDMDVAEGAVGMIGNGSDPKRVMMANAALITLQQKVIELEQKIEEGEAENSVESPGL